MNELISTAIERLRPGSQWSLNGDKYEGLMWLSLDVVKPTEAEVLQEVKLIETERLTTLPLRAAKAARHEEISKIQVTTPSGKTFDADSISQELMSRAIVGLDPLETTTWVLSNNVPTEVTREELRSALRLAGAAQTVIWVKPYL